MWSNLTAQLKSIGHALSSYVREKPLHSCLWAVFSLLTVWIFIMAIRADASPQWTGFGAYDESKQGARAKTLWDWMDLLIVPVTLAAGAYVLGNRQAANERKIAIDNQRQAALESYVDKMAKLLLDEDLRNSDSQEANIIARTRTLALFRQLDGDRKGNALQFISEVGLIDRSNPVIELSGLDLDLADLAGAFLDKKDLTGVDCTNANLKNASFVESILTGCIFSNSEMLGVDFSNALLDQAILSGCDLTDADFTGADLFMADFGGASVTLEQLEKAKSLKDAVLPDGSVYLVEQGDE